MTDPAIRNRAGCDKRVMGFLLGVITPVSRYLGSRSRRIGGSIRRKENRFVLTEVVQRRHTLFTPHTALLEAAEGRLDMDRGR